MFGLSNGYLLLIVVTLAIGGLATWYVNSQLKKYTHVPISTGLTGAEAARRMLMYYGIGDVEVHRGGPGQDFFDPRTNSVTLSPDATPAAPSRPRPRRATRWATPSSTRKATLP